MVSPTTLPYGNRAAIVGTATGLSAAGGLGLAGNLGVYGHAGRSADAFGTIGDGTSYGVFASGNLGASGSKTFRIDHHLILKTSTYCTTRPRDQSRSMFTRVRYGPTNVALPPSNSRTITNRSISNQLFSLRLSMMVRSSSSQRSLIGRRTDHS